MHLPPLSFARNHFFQNPPVIQPCYAPFREYVWGLHYIDELVYYYENEYDTQSAVITDANYNVTGLYELTQAASVHMQYHPYGRPLWLYDEAWHTLGDPNTGPLFDVDEVETPAERSIEDRDAPVRSTHMFQGHYFDRETNVIWMRNRPYHVKLGRFLTRDPNGTGLALATALARNADNLDVSASVSPMLQHTDGAHLYQFERSNPMIGQDPTGLSLLDTAWQEALSNWSAYLDTYPGRAWTRRIENVSDARAIFGEANSAYDEDILSAIEDLQSNKIDALESLEEASFLARNGHKLSRFYTQWGFEWDNYVWERDEAILYSLVGGGFFARACFAAGTSVALDNGDFKPIEQVRLGEQVRSEPGLVHSAQLYEEGDDNWVIIRLESVGEPASRVDISLLRPASWVRAIGSFPGTYVQLSIPEVSSFGPSLVTAIEPYSDSKIAISPGTVTGTFRTSHATMLGLYLEDSSEPIQATERHPFYSLDRDAWIGAGDLIVGERLRTVNGMRRVDLILPCNRHGTVYNIEVSGHHTYFVSPSRVLVHNGCVAGGGATVARLGSRRAERLQSVASHYNLEISVVGSRARGTASAFSDWDIVVPPGTSSRVVQSIKWRLRDVMSKPIEIFRSAVDTALPYITFTPGP